MQVKKRDGNIVKFNSNKIANAISAANKSVKRTQRATANERKEIIKYVKSLNMEVVSVEEIQDIIENKLMEFGKFELAKKYIVYREERTKIRNKNSQLMKDIAKKITASDVQNQNANASSASIHQSCFFSFTSFKRSLVIFVSFNTNSSKSFSLWFRIYKFSFIS